MSEQIPYRFHSGPTRPRRSWLPLVLAFSLVCGLLGGGVTALARETYASFVARVSATPPKGAVYRDDLETVLFSQTNAYRRGKGLAALALADSALQAAARAHAADMLQGDFVGHTSTSGAGFESRMRALNPGVMMLPRMAENAARERSDGPADEAKAGRLFQQWVKSGAHAKTMRSRDYVRVAIGVAEKGGRLYAVQIFLGPELKSNMMTTTPSAEAGEAQTLY